MVFSDRKHINDAARLPPVRPGRRHESCHRVTGFRPRALVAYASRNRSWNRTGRRTAVAGFAYEARVATFKNTSWNIIDRVMR